MMSMIRYKGGSVLIGVPARDMTLQEFNALPRELQRAVRECGCYVFDKPVPMEDKRGTGATDDKAGSDLRGNVLRGDDVKEDDDYVRY